MKTEGYIDSNGYRLIYIPEHPDAIRSGAFVGFVYEHRYIAEQCIGRYLYPDEVVHHLDNNKLNNHPNNLLVILRNQHIKLHNWINRNFIIPKPGFVVNKQCPICGNYVEQKNTYCSISCKTTASRLTNRPDIDQLGKDITSMPMTHVGEKYGVSDNAVRKWCHYYGLPYKRNDLV